MSSIGRAGRGRPPVVRIVNAVLELPGWVAALLQVTATLLLGYGVASRYIGKGVITSYTTEIAVLVSVWVAFLGAAEGIRVHYHVAINLLVSRLPPRWKAVSDFILGLIMTAGCGVLAYLGYVYLLESSARLQVTGWPRSLTIAAMPISFSFMALYLAMQSILALRGAIAGGYEIPASEYAEEDDAEAAAEVAEAERILSDTRSAA